MNYLAIDASTEACSVALKFNDQIYSRYDLCPQSHSLQLLPMVDQVLKEAGATLSQLDGLIFGRGPGSFTGVRIGIGVAQGLAFSANLPVVGISTLQTLAQMAYLNHKKTQVLVTIDARMSEVYCGCYQLDENSGVMCEQLAETVIAPEKVIDHISVLPFCDNQKYYGVGTGWDAYQQALFTLKINEGTPEILFPTAEAMLALGENEFLQGNGVSAEQAQPVYVRDTVSWKKLPGR